MKFLLNIQAVCPECRLVLAIENHNGKKVLHHGDSTCSMSNLFFECPEMELQEVTV